MLTGVFATSDSETLLDGLIVTGIGMGVVFIVLIALALASSTMSWLDASDVLNNVARKLRRGGATAPDLKEQPREDAAPALQDPPGPSREVIAAIAVAFAMARSSAGRQSPIGSVVAAGGSAWAAAGRRRAMDRASRLNR